MTETSSTNRRPRRRRGPHRSIHNTIGMSDGEIALLRSAIIRAVDGLPDRQLRVNGQRWHSFITDCGLMLGLEDELYVSPDTANETLTIVRDLADILRKVETGPGPTDLDRRMQWLGGTLGLDEVETDILGYFARCRLFDLWGELCSTPPFNRGYQGLSHETLAAISGHPAIQVGPCLATGSRLLQTGLIHDDGDGDFRAAGLLARIASAQTTDPQQLSANMMRRAATSTLEWDDFGHLGALRDFAHDLVAASQQGDAVSILLHGLAGTGKTEFARALADRLSFSAIFAGLADSKGAEPDRADRLAHLAILRSLTRGRSDHLIVVDEADDMLGLGLGNARQFASKLWVNSLVEEPVTPTIWIANDPQQLGPHILRRMSLAIEFTLPPRGVRQRIVTRQAERFGFAGVGAAADTAALPVAPAVLTNAIRAASLAGGDSARARLAGESILIAQGGLVPPREGLPPVYDATLACADHDLDVLADSLSRSKERNWSLLLCGPSGTGKSAFARHLAVRMGIELHERRGADLLSPLVGGTEAAIASAFSQSAKDGTLLVIDEIDNFLFGRRSAHRSWEISMVNEMLRWMDDLQAPFVATTNLAETLDPAVQRRFAMRLEFKPLRPEQSAQLFQKWFGMASPIALSGLTPGDFAVVAKRSRLLGRDDPFQLAKWLRAEAEERGSSNLPVGFGLPPLSAR